MANHVLNGVVGRVTAMLAISDAADRSDADLVYGFIQRGDANAFEAIVRRHGPMVLGVCRRLLRNAADAEDAFQATFIVLVRRAKSLRRPERLAGWLFQVAYRVARKARLRTVRQQSMHKPMVDVPVEDPVPRIVWNELRPIFDDELNRLPEKLRLPVVLCFLEGLSKREAALRLRWPEGTVSSRLQTARESLRGRLSGRGLALTTGAFQLALFHGTAPAAITPALLSSTIQSTAMPAAATTSAAGLLAEGVVQSMFVTKLKILAAGVLAIGLLGGGTGWVIGERGTSSAVMAQSGGPGMGKSQTKPTPDRREDVEFDLESAQTVDKKLTDEDFIRRAYLDVLGRLPSPEEVQEFKKKADANKRADAQLIDSLIAKQSFADRVQRFLQIRDPKTAPWIDQVVQDHWEQLTLQEMRSEKVAVDRETVRRLWLDLFGVAPKEDDPRVAERLRQFERWLRAANQEERQAEIVEARYRLRALEAQLAAEQARRKQIEERARYQIQMELARAAWEEELLRQHELSARIELIRATLAQQKERFAWAQQMLAKGYLAQAQEAAEKAQLEAIEAELHALIRKLEVSRIESAVREREAAVKKETDAIAKGTGSEPARDRALAALAESKIELSRLRIKEDLETLVSLRRREVERIAKAVEQKLLPAADLDKANKLLSEAKKRLADAEK